MATPQNANAAAPSSDKIIDREVGLRIYNKYGEKMFLDFQGLWIDLNNLNVEVITKTVRAVLYTDIKQFTALKRGIKYINDLKIDTKKKALANRVYKNVLQLKDLEVFKEIRGITKQMIAKAASNQRGVQLRL